MDDLFQHINAGYLRIANQSTIIDIYGLLYTVYIYIYTYINNYNYINTVIPDICH